MLYIYFDAYANVAGCYVMWYEEDCEYLCPERCALTLYYDSHCQWETNNGTCPGETLQTCVYDQNAIMINVLQSQRVNE